MGAGESVHPVNPQVNTSVQNLPCQVIYDMQSFRGDDVTFVRQKLNTWKKQKQMLNQQINQVCFVVPPLKNRDTSQQDRILETAKSMGFAAAMDEHHKNKVVVNVV